MATTQTSLTHFKLKPQNDAYTVLLSISLMAMIAACVLLFYDLKKYPKAFPDAQQIGVSPYSGGDPLRGGPTEPAAPRQ
jgi:hypothetical protein